MVPPSPLTRGPGPGGRPGRRPGWQQAVLQPGWAGPLLAMAGAVAFSGKAIIVKLAYRHGVDAITLIMLRMAVALPFFLLMVWWAGRGQAALPLRDKLAAAALGFAGYYLSSYLDFLGLQHITASLERLILYLTPAVVLLLSRALFGRRASGRQWAAMALGYGGLLLVFGHELRLDGPRVALGAALVLASTLSYAAYLLYSGEVVRRIGSLRLTGWASSVACALCLGQFALLRPLGGVAELAPPVVWLSLLNGTVCTVLPVLLVMMAIERIGSARAAQYGMVGPISTIILGVLVLGEPFTAWVAAGTLCVLGSVALLARTR
ncbi:MAG: DMT family transporter [Burkholderiaceae bacterium]|nr:DMT family transporter [Burkholderiaceae bacterium]